VQNVKRIYVCEGENEPGRNGLGSVGPGRPTWPIPTSIRPPFLEREDDATLSTWSCLHS
jgi:hypothetical protein